MQRGGVDEKLLEVDTGEGRYEHEGEVRELVTRGWAVSIGGGESQRHSMVKIYGGGGLSSQTTARKDIKIRHTGNKLVG